MVQRAVFNLHHIIYNVFFNNNNNSSYNDHHYLTYLHVHYYLTCRYSLLKPNLISL